MEMSMKSFILLWAMSVSIFAVTVGEIPKELTLSGESGGLAKDGATWHSSCIKDKVHVLFYVDPDEKDVNDEFFKTLDAKELNSTVVGRIAIVNLEAT